MAGYPSRKEKGNVVGRGRGRVVANCDLTRHHPRFLALGPVRGHIGPTTTYGIPHQLRDSDVASSEGGSLLVVHCRAIPLALAYHWEVVGYSQANNASSFLIFSSRTRVEVCDITET